MICYSGRTYPWAEMRDFIKCFRRDPAGRWICIQACEVELAGGRIQVAAGTVFTQGTLFMDVDIADLLEQQYAEDQRR